jgi:hypothetical protein
MPQPLDTRTCPLCGGPNGCGMKTGNGACWCSEATIARNVLTRVPAELQRKVCICQACGTESTETREAG